MSRRNSPAAVATAIRNWLHAEAPICSANDRATAAINPQPSPRRMFRFISGPLALRLLSQSERLSAVAGYAHFVSPTGSLHHPKTRRQCINGEAWVAHIWMIIFGTLRLAISPALRATQVQRIAISCSHAHFDPLPCRPWRIERHLRLLAARPDRLRRCPPQRLRWLLQPGILGFEIA